MSILEMIFFALGASLGVNLVFFLVAFLLKSDVFTDITYASTFFLVTLTVFLVGGRYAVPQILDLVLIGLWSVRLGSFLLVRIMRTKVDHRFDKMRDSFVKFGGFWLLQAITVWIVNFPSYLLMAHSAVSNWSTYLFFGLALVFLLWETVADAQKYHFNLQHHGQFIQTGLWKTSRHPNYFGEYMFWWMLFGLVLLSGYENLNWLGIVGPFAITVLLYFLSGVPILERRSLAKFGSDPLYQKYLQKTACVVPFCGRRGYRKWWGNEKKSKTK